MPWLAPDYNCVRDDFSLIDASYELVMEKKRREVKLKPNRIGMSYVFSFLLSYLLLIFHM
jgi:hypothetical protein